MAKFKVVFREDHCKGCELCVTVCPKHILEMRRDVTNAKGYSPAGIMDPDACIGCASCALMCPDGIINIYSIEE